MKNFEKYATASEADDAFYSYCNSTRCQYCRFFENYDKISCCIQWLYYDDDANPTPQWQENLMEKFTNKE